MATFFQNLTAAVLFLLQRFWLLLAGIVLAMFIALGIGKIYQSWDKDPDRGAIAIQNGEFGEDYSTPVYLDQGWSESDSLWFYNTTQGSALLPYSFFLALEQADSEVLFRDNNNMDKYRYLPQKPTFFNPDGLAVGFTKDTYKGKDYMGFTCAACHTGQVNYQGQAIRIDGGPAMADMVGFLTALQTSMETTLEDSSKLDRFVSAVLDSTGDFRNRDEVVAGLQKWTGTVGLYNVVNHSSVDYGYARLDAFGRIYNRVLQHVINKPQLADKMKLVQGPTGNRILTDAEIDNVLAGVNEYIIGDDDFALIIERLASTQPGFPGLNLRDQLRVRDAVFNEPDAPVSYPFLWDITHSDYVQWNGLANNAGIGPLGRNAGEVIGVFGILDWEAHEADGFNLAARITGQEDKSVQVSFDSSIDMVNLHRLEDQLTSLQSPQWPEEILGDIDWEQAERGQLLYARYCQSCHEVIERDNWDRVVIAKMSKLSSIGTDVAMAENSVQYTGASGNLVHTTQTTDVGDVFIEAEAPVVQILTGATRGVIGTPDPDKMFLRRWLDRIYVLAASLFDNDMPATIKSGDYDSDTTSNPYSSLLSYKARSLNGIWATAPYLHNGSVPTLYDLLLPSFRPGDPPNGEYRPESFEVGSREFDPVKVGMRSEGYDGFTFNTFRRGDMNGGHEYAAGRTPQLDGSLPPALNEEQRWDLIEYIKTL